MHKTLYPPSFIHQCQPSMEKLAGLPSSLSLVKRTTDECGIGIYALHPFQHGDTAGHFLAVETQEITHAHAHVAGVGVMAVHHVGHELLSIQSIHEVIGETAQMIPQLFFRQAFIWPSLNAHDARFIAQRLNGLRVIALSCSSRTQRVTKSTRATSSICARARARSTTYLV